MIANILSLRIIFKIMFLIIFLTNILFAYNSDPTGVADANYYFLNSNPASLNNNIVVGYSPNNFEVEELDFTYLSLNYNQKIYSLNVNFISDNNELNRELLFSTGAVYKYNNLFNIGIKLNYLNNYIKGYSSIHNFFCDIGAIFYFNNIAIASYFNNIYSSDLKIENNKYLKSGISYSDSIFTGYFGTDIVLGNSYGLLAGIKYHISNNIKLRLAYSTLYKSAQAVLSIVYQNYIINLSLARHNSLGYSQDYQLLYDF